MLGAVTFLSSVCIWVAASSLSCLSHASLRQAAAPRASASTNDSVLSGARSAKHLLPSLPFPSCCSHSCPGQVSSALSTRAWGSSKQSWSPQKTRGEFLRGIPESHWGNLTQGHSGRGFHHRRITLLSAGNKHNIFLCSLLILTCQICCWSPLQSGHSLAQLVTTFCQKHWCQRMVSLKRTPCRVSSSFLQNSRGKCGYFHD